MLTVAEAEVVTLIAASVSMAVPKRDLADVSRLIPIKACSSTCVVTIPASLADANTLNYAACSRSAFRHACAARL